MLHVFFNNKEVICTFPNKKIRTFVWELLFFLIKYPRIFLMSLSLYSSHIYIYAVGFYLQSKLTFPAVWKAELINVQHKQAFFELGVLSTK